MANVSVIIPSHNDQEFVAATIESLLTQTDVPQQIIVIDDSDDDTAGVVQRYTHGVNSPVTLIRHPKCNVSQARNAGLRVATCKYLAFVDGDDIWLPSKTQRQLEILERHPDAVGVHCRFFQFVQELDDLDRREPLPIAIDEPDIEHIILGQNLPASAVMIRHQGAADLRFDEQSGHGEDTIYAADLRLSGCWRILDEPAVGKRVHAGQVTRSPWHQVWNAQTRVRWCHQRAEKLGQDRAHGLEQKIWDQLITYFEDRYWRRELDDLVAIKRRIAQLCPERWSQSFLSKKRVYPRWVYRVRDAVSGRDTPQI